MSKKLTNLDLCQAAKRLRTGVAEIRAVDEVESRGGGFDSQGRVKILFERHKFWLYAPKNKRNEWRSIYPNICNPNSGGYGKESAQYGRFSQAFALDPKAAMLSCSWGRYQIMGFNYAICGYKTIDEFVDAMKTGEGEQLLAFCAFVEANHLGDEIRGHKWAAFARGYNGAAYKKNNYDTKLSNAYSKFKKEKIDCDKLIADAKNKPLPTKPPKVDNILPEDNSQITDASEDNSSEFGVQGLESENDEPQTPSKTPVEDPQPDGDKPEIVLIPNMDSAKRWLQTVGGFLSASTITAYLANLPNWLVLSLLGLFAILLIGGIIVFIVYRKEVFAYVAKMHAINLNPEMKDVIIKSHKKESKL